MNKATTNGRRGEIKWGMIVLLIFFHTGAFAALFMFSWQALMVALLLWWVAGSLGIGMGYHRLLTHRSYQVSKPVEYFLTICGSLALEGGSIPWVSTHRVHHAFTDRAGDPHSPRDGCWWAHIGWILRSYSMGRAHPNAQSYAADLARRPFHLWLTRLHWAPLVILSFVLYALGGWPFVLWGVFMRIVSSWHATWLVNSASHLWGRRRFDTRDDSRNNWWVALLTFGEGWHNNHHAYPSSARHGLAWYEIDFNWCGIRVLQLLGLAKRIRQIKARESIPEPGSLQG